MITLQCTWYYYHFTNGEIKAQKIKSSFKGKKKTSYLGGWISVFWLQRQDLFVLHPLSPTLWQWNVLHRREPNPECLQASLWGALLQNIFAFPPCSVYRPMKAYLVAISLEGSPCSFSWPAPLPLHSHHDTIAGDHRFATWGANWAPRSLVKENSRDCQLFKTPMPMVNLKNEQTKNTSYHIGWLPS